MTLPTVHVDALWHLRNAGSADQRWLRELVARSAEPDTDTDTGPHADNATHEKHEDPAAVRPAP